MELLVFVLADTLLTSSKTTSELLRCLTGALLAFSTHCDAKSRLATETAVVSLCACLFTNISDITTNSTRTIRNVLNVPGSAASFVRQLLQHTDLVVEVLHTSATAPLASLLNLDAAADKVTQEQSLQVLQALSVFEVKKKKGWYYS